jgi:hypothetical protein
MEFVKGVQKLQGSLGVEFSQFFPFEIPDLLQNFPLTKNETVSCVPCFREGKIIQAMPSFFPGQAGIRKIPTTEVPG